DDNATHRQIIRKLLENWGMVSEAASGTEEAQQALDQINASGKSLDLILIDSNMPGKDGLSLIRWIKNQNRVDGHVIMMLTFSSLRLQTDLHDLGVRASITKPIRPSDLMNAIITALDTTPPPTEAPDKKIEREHLPLKILVAEDTPFNQKFILRLLTRWGYQGVIAENGRDAVEALTKDSFDLVFMDVQMPEMDGFEATEAIRESEKQTGQHIPIIAMTAHAMKGDRERCIESGMDDYISKPISSGSLFEKIQALVSVDAPDVSPAESAEDVHTSFDREKLLDVFDHDWDFLKEAIDIFIADYPPMLNTIGEALKNKDMDSMKWTVHALKGMVGNFQAHTTYQAALKLEEILRQENIEGADLVYQELSAQLSKLEKSLLDLTGERSG
ncbi:MAG: response regulator, partial [Deltaproteobacteria bacterium]|nr:response regulator [Deltaproteobacteria bacterium]